MTEVITNQPRGVEDPVWKRVMAALSLSRFEAFAAELGAARAREARQLTGLTTDEMVVRGYAQAVKVRPETR